jgi:uncharacterized membrane protein HdeD (DUF308 family)
MPDAQRRASASGLAGPNVPGFQGFFGWIADQPLTRDALRRARKRLIVAGLIALINGVVAILVPAVASLAFSIFIGWVLIAAAITMGVSAIARRAPLRMLEAVLTLIAGFYVLAFPLSGTVTLTFVLAVWLFAGGVVTLTHAFGVNLIFWGVRAMIGARLLKEIP